jgi:integrase
MPRAWGKKNEFKNLPLEQILNKKYDEIISSDAVNKHITTMSNFFNYAVHHHYMSENYIAGMKIPINKSRAREQRDQWSVEQLNALFSKENYLLDGPAHMFWLPIIAILTGARLGEIAQLRCCDVKSVSGIVYIDINDEDGKRIKNQQSKRNVPLNDAIVKELNFLQFVESMRVDEKSQLFPELYGFKSHPEKIASSHFSKFKQRELGIENAKVNFHSLRHNARNMVPSNVTDNNLLDDYFGWEGEGEGNSRYRKAENIITLYKKITKRMKIEFDFSALKSSPWVTSSASTQQKPRKEKVKRFTWKK